MGRTSGGAAFARTLARKCWVMKANNPSLRRRLARRAGVPNARRCCACWGGSEAERNKKRFFDTGVARLLLASRNDAQRLPLLIAPEARRGPAPAVGGRRDEPRCGVNRRLQIAARLHPRQPARGTALYSRIYLARKSGPVKIFTGFPVQSLLRGPPQRPLRLSFAVQSAPRPPRTFVRAAGRRDLRPDHVRRTLYVMIGRNTAITLTMLSLTRSPTTLSMFLYACGASS